MRWQQVAKGRRWRLSRREGGLNESEVKGKGEKGKSRRLLTD